MSNLQTLSNLELTDKMYHLTMRYGELSLWITECDQKVCAMIREDRQDQFSIAREIELKHQADVEKYIILSDLKKIELEMDRRVGNVQ